MKSFESLELGPDTMPANLKPSIIIKKRDAWLYHIKCQQVIINPADIQHPIVRQKMLIMLPGQYDYYFGKVSEKQREENARTMNIRVSGSHSRSE